MSVLDVVRRINSEPSAARLAATILEETLSLCGAQRGALVLLKKDVPVACVSRDLDGGDPAPLRSLALRVIRQAFRQGGSFSVADARKDPRLAELRAGAVELPRSLLSVPFQVRGGVQGAIYLDAPRPAAFSEREIELAGVVAEHGAAAIRLANLRESMRRDPATGALTPAAFDEGLARELARRTPCAVLRIRIDNLQSVQAEHGPGALRALLRAVARSIAQLLPPAGSPVVGRRSAGVFDALLPGTSGPDALRAAERLAKRLAAHDFHLERGSVRVAVSTAVAAYPKDAPDVASLLDRLR
jgi:GGDEF domain-containing protein